MSFAIESVAVVMPNMSKQHQIVRMTVANFLVDFSATGGVFVDGQNVLMPDRESTNSTFNPLKGTLSLKCPHKTFPVSDTMDGLVVVRPAMVSFVDDSLLSFLEDLRFAFSFFLVNVFLAFSRCALSMHVCISVKATEPSRYSSIQTHPNSLSSAHYGHRIVKPSEKECKTFAVGSNKVRDEVQRLPFPSERSKRQRESS